MKRFRLRLCPFSFSLGARLSTNGCQRLRRGALRINGRFYETGGTPRNGGMVALRAPVPVHTCVPALSVNRPVIRSKATLIIDEI